MKQQENPSVFPMGNKLPEELSSNFIGQAYLQPLTACEAQVSRSKY